MVAAAGCRCHSGSQRRHPPTARVFRGGASGIGDEGAFVASSPSSKLGCSGTANARRIVDNHTVVSLVVGRVPPSDLVRCLDAGGENDCKMKQKHHRPVGSRGVRDSGRLLREVGALHDRSIPPRAKPSPQGGKASTTTAGASRTSLSPWPRSFSRSCTSRAWATTSPSRGSGGSGR